MDIKNMEKTMINVPEIPEGTYSRVDIFIWDNNPKEENIKEKN